jgi:tRNA threonylcarbamoyl adenosine modification protein YeaZ
VTLILSIDTSGPAVVVGLDDAAGHRAGESGWTEASHVSASTSPPAHGEELAPAIAELLARFPAAATDLTHLVVGVGPGPFTGLRVGIVTARVMADALGVPLIGVCSLDAIARVARRRGLVTDAFTVLTDARRREVYVRRYDAGGAAIGEPWVSRAEDLPADVRNGPVVGPGAALYPDAFEDVRSVGGVGMRGLTSIAHDAALGLASAEIRDTTPLYLRRPDAVESHARKRVTQP